MTEHWEPLGIRYGWWEDEAPYEEIPDHLRTPIEEWATKYLGGEDAHGYGGADPRARNLAVIASRLRMSFNVSSSRLAGSMVSVMDTDPHRFLEMIDLSLWITSGIGAGELELILHVAGSVWGVSGDHRRLERRVEEAERDAYVAAISPRDEAAENLAESWRKVYGINPDPSDSWDHSIKAVEALLWGRVVAKNPTATLGSIIKALSDKPSNWTFRLTPSGPVGGVETLVNMLRLMWPNPDRHGSGTVRMPTQEEAEDVVRLAVLIVGWLRSNALVKVQ